MSPTGGALGVSGGDVGVAVLDPRTGRVRRQMEMEEGDLPFYLSFSDDGRRMATVEFNRREAVVWDVATGKQTRPCAPRRRTGRPPTSARTAPRSTPPAPTALCASGTSTAGDGSSHGWPSHRYDGLGGSLRESLARWPLRRLHRQARTSPSSTSSPARWRRPSRSETSSDARQAARGTRTACTSRSLPVTRSASGTLAPDGSSATRTSLRAGRLGHRLQRRRHRAGRRRAVGARHAARPGPAPGRSSGPARRARRQRGRRARRPQRRGAHRLRQRIGVLGRRA